MELKIKYYQTASGKKPCKEWINNLADTVGRMAIRMRLNRVRLGNFGVCEPITSEISELKFYIGPGYRLYFSKIGSEVVLLLCGGDKGSQNKDIAKAKKYLEDYKIRRLDGE